jgi:hypothetical protein
VFGLKEYFRTNGGERGEKMRRDIRDQISAIRRQEKRDGNTEFTEIGTQRAQRTEKARK